MGLSQKTPSWARCRLVVRDFASGAESAFRSGVYAPTSSLDSLRCVLALASLWDLWLITSDVSTAFMYAEVEEDVAIWFCCHPTSPTREKELFAFFSRQ